MLNVVKSGGYRVIYYRPIDDSVVLITLYSKTEQQDIEAHEIQAILQEDTDFQSEESNASEPSV